MADLTDRCEVASAADSTEQADEPKTRTLTLDGPGPALTHPGSLPGGDDALLPPGTRLDDYEVVAKLGGGGMGQVYRVRHVRLDREFALKIIASRQITPQALQRFEREMKAVGRTNHPNVILATDAGECQGLYYLVMELVPGTDLAQLVKRIGPLPVAEASEVTRQAALGLQAIHEAGLVHRDIKPHNLMLTPDGAVKVLDLGLARLVGEKGDTLTENGSMGGTADYMAPEQALDLHSVKISADLYSLGCTLYCLLAGRPPFGDDQHSSFASKLMAHSSEPVPPLAVLRPELVAKPELLRLLERMLAKAPAMRPAEPREVAERLGPLSVGHDLTNLAAAPRGVSPVPQAVPRPRVWIARARKLGIGVACLAGLVFGLIQGMRPGDAEPKPGPSGADLSEFQPIVKEPPIGLVDVKATALVETETLNLPDRPSGATPTVPDQESAPLRIESLEVQHYRGNPAQLQGTIGVLAHAARFDDNVRVSARLSAPGYCYLIALNPDGTIQLCPRGAEHTPPSPTAEIHYPAESDNYYGLTDGTGLQAFVLVASRAPLPPFDSWPGRSGLSWASAGCEAAWRFDGHDFVCLGDPIKRGTERRAATAVPAPFVAVCRALSTLPKVDAIQASAFPVLPADESQTSAKPAP